MGRGLGERQREVLDRLAGEPPGTMVPLHRLVEDPDDSVELARVRSAIRGLERRRLVVTSRMADPGRLVDTVTVRGYFDDLSGRMLYLPDQSQREWYGMHIMLAAGYVDPDDVPRLGRQLRAMCVPDDVSRLARQLRAMRAPGD